MILRTRRIQSGSVLGIRHQTTQNPRGKQRGPLTKSQSRTSRGQSAVSLPEKSGARTAEAPRADLPPVLSDSERGQTLLLSETSRALSALGRPTCAASEKVAEHRSRLHHCPYIVSLSFGIYKPWQLTSFYL